MEDEITCNKGRPTNMPSRIIVESLVVLDLLNDGGVPDLFKHVDIRPALLLSPIFVREANARSIKIEVR